MKHQITVDSCHYNTKNGGTCIISGWIYTGNISPDIQAKADRESIDFDFKRTLRPDVIKAFPDADFPDEMAGFELKLSGIEEMIRKSQTLRVRLTCLDEKIPVLQKTPEELYEEYWKDTVRFLIEKTEKRLDKVYIQGWGISYTDQLDIKVTDENGKEFSSLSWNKMRRSDLAELFEVDIHSCHGFAFELKRNEIRGSSLVIEFRNQYTAKTYTLDMKSFDKENGTLGRMMKLFDKENRAETLEIIRQNGVASLQGYMLEKSGTEEEYYNYFAGMKAPSSQKLREQKRTEFLPAPLFSIVVPLYETPLPYLKELIDSVTAQSYGNWQLCLADGSQTDQVEKFIKENYRRDKRIDYRRVKENLGISGNTNAAIEMAGGDYIVFADHDDTITPDALYENAKIIRDCPDAELIYSDEDLTDENGRPYDPHFKPDFNLDYLRSINYICHLTVVKRTLLDQVGMLNAEYDGAQDFDFILRCSEKAKAIYHIPKVLYHWRSHSGSTAGNEDNKQYAIDAGKKALEAHYERLGIPAQVRYTGHTVVYETRYEVLGNPKVSILIPNKDHIDDLDKCVRSILEKSTWGNYEIIVIENNSTETETFAYYKKIAAESSRVKVVRYCGSFNYSAINNLGRRYASGEYLILLNNDTEVITEDWMERMIGHCQRPEVGIVGAKLYYPDDTIQHAGVILGIGGIAGHVEVGREKAYTGYMRRLVAAQDLSAVTAACLMIKADLFDQLSGLSPELAVAFNDVDLCIRVRKEDYLVVFDPAVELYHYESKSRGYETTPEKIRRFQGEIEIFKNRHADVLEKGDPYYNPNLSLTRGDMAVARVEESIHKQEKFKIKGSEQIVERDRFLIGEPDCYLVEGRIPKECTVEAYLDTLKLTVSVTELPEQSRRGEEDETPGGRRVAVKVSLPKDLKRYKTLNLYIAMGMSQTKWFSISAKTLFKKRGKPQYFIEEENINRENRSIYIRGWAVSDTRTSIAFFDENKNRLSADIKRHRRMDVEEMFREVSSEDEFGFHAELTNLPGKFIYIVIRDENQKRISQRIGIGKTEELWEQTDRLRKKGMDYMKANGIKALFKKAVRKFMETNERPPEYDSWRLHVIPTEAELGRQREQKFKYEPKISIVVPLYKSDEAYLTALIDSVKAQTYKNWELCLSDGSGAHSPIEGFLKKAAASDERIKIVYPGEALHISDNTNQAIEIATGEYIAFADHDDELTPDALFECVQAVNEQGFPDVIYSDEDKMSAKGSKYFDPAFKPDYNKDLLCTVNYICHLFVVKRELLAKAGLLRDEFNGAQDYDLVLRCTEQTDRIYHIPKVLYHWRSHEGSTSENPESKRYAFEAGRRAVQAHYDRMGIPAEAFDGEYPGLYRTKYHWKDKPLVSIIIPNKDHIEDLERCISSIEKLSTYDHYEYVIVENNSTEAETFEYYKKLEAENPKVKVVFWEREFNYSEINNFGASHASGDYLLLLNNDTEVINPDWIEEMLGYCMREDVGIVGARLYYDDNTIQHAGVVLGFGGVAGHCFVQQPRDKTGYAHRIICAQDYSAVTAACMMVDRRVFEEVGGLSPDLAVAFNDIDFCLKVRNAGYLIVYNPYAELYHYESKSRGLEDTPEKRERFARETATIKAHWPKVFSAPDPYYNPNLTLKSQDFSLRRI